MLRRDFLGSTLGTFAMSKLPWVATPLPDNDFISNESIEPDEKIIRLFCSSKQDIKSMVKGSLDIINLDEPTIIQHENIRDVIFHYNAHDILTVLFKLEDVNVTQSIISTKTSLLYAYDNKVMRPYVNFHGGRVYANNGDTLKISNDITCYMPNKYLNKIKKEHEILTYEQYLKLPW